MDEVCGAPNLAKSVAYTAMIQDIVTHITNANDLWLSRSSHLMKRQGIKVALRQLSALRLVW